MDLVIFNFQQVNFFSLDFARVNIQDVVIQQYVVCLVCWTWRDSKCQEGRLTWAVYLHSFFYLTDAAHRCLELQIIWNSSGQAVLVKEQKARGRKS